MEPAHCEVCPAPPPKTFACECGSPHRLYVVTDYEDREFFALYCDVCQDLAAVDWNGETKAIRPVRCEPVDAAYEAAMGVDRG